LTEVDRRQRVGKRTWRFKLQYDPADIPELVKKYMASEEEKERRMEAAGAAIRAGDLTRHNLITICKWKSPRRIALMAKNTDAEIEGALRGALHAVDIRKAVTSLVELHGVGVKMASAILTAIDPERYTVLDVRALEALGVANGESLDLYVSYLDACQRISREGRVKMRDFDRSNWQWSKLKAKMKTGATYCG
jgi:hypothetical protein